jgi:HEAT repeat protein
LAAPKRYNAWRKIAELDGAKKRRTLCRGVFSMRPFTILPCLLWVAAAAGLQAFEQADFQPLQDSIAQLKAPSPEARAEAARELGQRTQAGSLESADAQRVVSGLIEALHDQDASVRLAAAHSLTQIGRPRAKGALEALQAASKDPDGRVRVVALLGVWKVARDEACYARVLEALTEESPEVRKETVSALASHAPNKDTVLALIPVLKDKDETVAEQARYALRLASAVAGSQAKEAVPALMRMLGDDDPKVRHVVVAALAGIGPEAGAAQPLLIRALRDPNDDVRATTAWALGKVGTDRKIAVAALIEALSDKYGRARMEAAYSLGITGAEASAGNPALQQAARDRLVSVRVASRLALWRTTGDETYVALAIDDAAANGPGQLGNASAFLEQAGAPAVPLLVGMLGHRDAKVRSTAVLTLALIGPPAKPALPSLIKALKDSDQEVRKSAAEAILRIEPSSAVKSRGK